MTTNKFSARLLSKFEICIYLKKKSPNCDNTFKKKQQNQLQYEISTIERKMNQNVHVSIKIPPKTKKYFQNF